MGQLYGYSSTYGRLYPHEKAVARKAAYLPPDPQNTLLHKNNVTHPEELHPRI